jgi:serine phosphatase RsbU (regulator of sigma subunit)
MRRDHHARSARPPKSALPIWGVIGVYLAVICSVAVMLYVGERALLGEVRSKARNLASLVAHQISAAQVQVLQTPADMKRPEFKALLQYIQSVKTAHPDIAFVYILRPTPNREGVPWTFVIDAQPEDLDTNGNSKIEPEEEGVKPGAAYRGLTDENEGDFQEALHHPIASRHFYSDYWGTFISGYAPIREPGAAEAVAILGIDVTRGRVVEKYKIMNLTAALVLLILLALMTLTLRALSGKAAALHTIQRLDAELQERNTQLQQQNIALEQSIQELTEREMLMREEMALAQQIQQRFLPQLQPFAGVLEFGSHYRACGTIGGDLYDVFPLTDSTIGFYMADVTGHGVSAALITAALKVSVERYRQLILEITLHEQFHAPRRQRQAADTAIRQFLHELNKSMCDIMLAGQFISFQIGILQLKLGHLTIGNAGHLQPLLWHAETASVDTLLLPSNVPLGLFPEWTFECAHMEWRPGDKLVLYTDGVIEQLNTSNEEYGIQNLMEVVRTHQHLSARQLTMNIVQSVRAFGQPLDPQDDQAILVMAQKNGHALSSRDETLPT